jgi:hypothetical protein
VNRLRNPATQQPWLRDEAFGMLVESVDGRPFAVERAMDWTPPGQPWWKGGLAALGIPLA